MSDLRDPHSPFLELSFYFANRPESDALTAIAGTLIKRGSRLRKVTAISRPGARTERYGRDVATPQDELVAIDPSREFTEIFGNPDLKVCGVSLEGALDMAADVGEGLSYLPLRSSEAIERDQHPIVLFADGQVWDRDAFDSKSGQGAKRARWAGLQAYRLLRGLVEATEPSYAAIAVERIIESPWDLMASPSDANGFSDFFVSVEFAGKRAVDKIRRLFLDAFVEEWDRGLYISSSRDFNPEGLEVEGSLIPRMIEVASLVGGAGISAARVA